MTFGSQSCLFNRLKTLMCRNSRGGLASSQHPIISWTNCSPRFRLDGVGELNGLFEGYVPLSYASSSGLVNVKQNVEHIQNATEQTKMTDNLFCQKHPDGMYRCPTCDKPFAHRSTALEHQKSHSTDRDIHCSLCIRSFKSKNSLRGHLRKTHANQADYLPLRTPSKQVRESEERGNPCPECDKSFATWDSLQRHRKSLHGKEEGHTCDECGKLLSHKRHLYQHLREVHMKDYQKRCEQCGKKFGRSYTLKRHIKYVHGGDQGGN
ncbi:hypothetical protein CRM22_003459 [Opisthorchis felineus]|uniref:C2H2-type domain-containing protein n=1 Tax=Opisthorchis felineus TaxID=147828 RepID=A0A4S2M772_OPIFE|nr:hypothetical protein CRM22_003459 [Opisthorchis felineus]